MDFVKMSFPESEKNIKTTKRYAKSKELSLRGGKDLWHVIELQTGRILLKDATLKDAYDFIDQYVY